MSSSFLRLRDRASRVLAAAAVVLAILPSSASRADSVAQSLPFSQDWTNTGLITTADNWNGLPGIVGYRGDGITGGTGVDPQTLLADGTDTPVNVLIGQTPSLATGGVAEFDGLANPVVAMQGSGTADAPFLLITISTLGKSGITVAYNVRDVDGTADNTNQQIALHYRIGTSGAFTNVPAGYIADATTGPSLATLVTAVSAVLPASADNQPVVQVRIMTTNAAASDEWVGIDDISITGSAVSTTNPSGAGSANPATVFPGQASLLTVNVTPGAVPPSTGIVVSADLSSIGGSSTQAFANNGGNSFSFSAVVAMGTAFGPRSLPVTITDAEGRSGSTTISLQVDPPPPPLGHLVISQIYGGGGNTGATYQNDFIELYNPGTSPVDVTGWTVQYGSATGSFSASLSQPLAGVIGPGEYYLVALGSGGAVGADLPPANVSNADINMSATNGKVALASNGEPISTATCPLSDADLVDFVGYGTANCKEGGATAPAGSNTTSLFRKNEGNTDTDQNGADFVMGTPDPRRTAAIAEVGPRVQSTEPTRNGTNAPRDSSVTVTFSEPVDLTNPWVHVVCVSTGAHDDATLAGGPTTYVFTPNVNFVAGESCTATITRDAVHDQDLDDASLDTDILPADHVWSFTVATGTAPPYPPEVHLTMGNPSGATADLDTPNNYLMEKPEFALSYNRDQGTPNWVSWHLEDVWTGSLVRNDTFRPDPAVPPDWYRVQATDFFSTGFDRGHMTPNADRDFQDSIPINQATFLMTNMIPQAPDNNQGPWANLENYLRTLLPATPTTPANEIYIVSGPVGIGGSGANGGFTTTLANGHVTVPAFTWKVALVLPKAGGDDVARVSAATRTIAVIMPNTQGIRTTNPNDWEAYLTTVDAVEALTGYDFFASVEDAVENSIEAGTNGVNPPGAADQLVTLEEDSSQSFTLNAVGANPSTLTYTILSPPAHGAVTGSDGGRTYTPVQDFVGTDRFTYAVSDGVTNSNTATVTIQVLEVNDSPVPANDVKVATEDASLFFAGADLTANDAAGPASEAGQILTIANVFGGADTHGTVSLAGGFVSYVPEANFSGTASFTYQVCDDGFSAGVPDPKCATGAVTVEVSPLNDPPTLNVPTSHTVSLGGTLTFVALGADADIPVQALAYGLSGAVPAGASINPATGVFTWTPTAAQSGGAYAFNVTVTDGISPTSVAIAVSVIGPLGIEQGVLARVKALRNTVHDRSDRRSLDDVIQDLTEAVQAKYWLDASHLEPRRGDRVFDENEQAVRELAKLRRECHSRIPDAVLQGFIDDLVRATRLIAETAIGDAIAAHGDGKDIAKANVDLADGNRDAARGRSDDAIRSYESAWARALKAVR